MFTYLLRMYQYHRKENQIFFLSQCMGIVLLQFVETFMNDSSFMEHYAVVSDVLVDMMRLLDILVVVSTVIFIILSHWYYFRNQAKEYTTFQCAGMSKTQALGLYLVGFLIIDVLVLAIGIILGSVFANLCYGLLIVAFNLPLNLPLIHLAEVQKVVAIAAASDVGAMFWLVIFSASRRKKSKQTENHMYSKSIAIITILLLLIAYATHWEMDGVIAVIALVPGLLFLDFGILKFCEMQCKKKDARGVMRFEKAIKLDAIKKNQGVILTAGFIFSLILVFTASFFLDINYWDKYVYRQQNPFDLVIANYEILPDLSNKQISEILGKAETPITYEKEINSLRDGAFSFFSVEDVNNILTTDYQVRQGEFIQVFRIYGRFPKKDFLSTNTIEKNINGKSVTLKKGGEASNILFGYHKSMADQIILLNQDDFQMLQRKGSDVLKQDVYLYRFKDWKKTGPVIAELKHILGNEEAYRAACSKIEGYRQVKEGYHFFAVTMIPILCCLFFFGFLQFQFAVRLQMEKDKKEFYRLNCLGIGSKERDGVKHRLLVFFYTKPFLLAVLNGAYFAIWFRIVFLYT